MPESFLDVDDPELIDRLRPLARRLLDPKLDEQVADAKGALAGALEFALCRFMRLNAESAGLWCDGVGFQQVERQPEGGLRCSGTAWCADHESQWLVPLFVELSTDGAELTRIVLGLGDGALEHLSQHKGRSHRIPGTWLVRYHVVAAPRGPALAPLVVIGSLQQWLADNPQGRVVGADWQDLSLEAAHHFVQEEANGGRAVVLEPTWLEGGPVIRVVEGRDHAKG